MDATLGLSPLMDRSAFDLSQNDFEFLLGDLCVELGCCINGLAAQRLWESQPSTVDEFVERLFAAEGLQEGVKGRQRSIVKLYVQNFIAARHAP